MLGVSQPSYADDVCLNKLTITTLPLLSLVVLFVVTCHPEAPAPPLPWGKPQRSAVAETVSPYN